MNAPVNPSRFFDLGPTAQNFKDAVLFGLSQNPKRIPARYLYDERGSHLFELIGDTDEYYLTRTELALLRSIAPEIATFAGPGPTVIEFGGGSSSKICTFLDALDRAAAFVSVDISTENLTRAADEIANHFPELQVSAIGADFMNLARLPQSIGGSGKRLGFFLGATVGNLPPRDAVRLLAKFRQLLGRYSGLVVGVDLKKDPKLLNAAYNDRKGINAAFNLNLLHRIARQLDSDIDIRSFSYDAFYNADESRIETHLRSLKDQQVRIAGHLVEFVAGEAIHIGSSYKYDIEEFGRVARDAGFLTVKAWTDRDSLYSVHYLRPID